MNCREIKNLLPLFLEDELPQEKNSQIKIHLERCLDCKKELELFKKSWDLIKNYNVMEISADFKAKFWREISEKESVIEKRPFFRFPQLLPKWIPAFAVLILILVGSGGIYLRNIFIDRNIRNFASMNQYEDVSMLQELDLAENLDLVENINMLEEAEIIESVEL